MVACVCVWTSVHSLTEASLCDFALSDPVIMGNLKLSHIDAECFPSKVGGGVAIIIAVLSITATL